VYGALYINITLVFTGYKHQVYAVTRNEWPSLEAVTQLVKKFFAFHKAKRVIDVL
jgi:hypothetical protein